MTAAGGAAVALLLRRFCRPAVIAMALAFLTLRPGANNEAQAVIERIYTLPFRDAYIITCGFGCYEGHQGTDYQLGVTGAPGEAVVAAASGTVWWFEQFPPFCEIPYCAGYYIAADHGNGHKTRYLHLNDRTGSDGDYFNRGDLIGHEGNSGTGAYHLHFETRHNAMTGDCCSGTAVDPYDPSTYMWTTNPPSHYTEQYIPIMPGPDACSWGSNRLDVVVRGDDGHVYKKWTEGSTWQPSGYWENLGGMTAAGPSCVSRDDYRLRALARGTDDALWNKWWQPPPVGWFPGQDTWQQVGGVLTSGPDACSWGTSRIDAFVRGADNGVWHRYWDGSWHDRGEVQESIVTSDPSCVSRTGSHIDLFARGTNNYHLWHNEWDGDEWTGWHSLGGPPIPEGSHLTSAPDACSWSSNRVDVFARGADNGLWHIWRTGTTWHGWQEILPDQLALGSAPTCISKGYPTLDVFMRGTGPVLWRARWASDPPTDPPDWHLSSVASWPGQ